MQRVNYDRIAHLYDEPWRDHDVDPNLLAYLGEHPEISPWRLRLLDAGCGTGKQLAANGSRFPGTFMVGLDLFEGMLRIAQRRGPTIAWVRGDGAQMPLRSNSFDYASNQFSYAHILDKENFFHEVYRVLKPGGRLVVTNIDPWSMQQWVLYRFFPAARELDYRDFLPVDRLVALLEELGFVDVRAQQERRVVRENLADFYAYASQRHRASHFMALSDEEYRTGVSRIEQTMADAKEQPVVIDSEFCLLTVIGDKPVS